MSFPIDTSAYKAIPADPAAGALGEDQKAQLLTNIQCVRDTIVLFTAVAGIKGYGGHTGGAYSIVPEVLIADCFMKHSDRYYPVYFDEAGHRVAIQYAMAAFNGELPFEKLLEYRAAGEGLYGHPEIDAELGIKFASGRLGHMWPFVNGVAKANPDKVIFLFGSDGSQMEGNDAEAARFAVAQQCNIKLCVDDNNVTISGHPADYMPGYDVAKTLEGHGLTVDAGDGEDVDALFARMAKAVTASGPVALVNRRKMAPGIPGVEGTHAGHDVIPKDAALAYFKQRGLGGAITFLEGIGKGSGATEYKGSSKEQGSNRNEFGKIVNGILDEMSAEERTRNVLVIDSDLEGSTGLKLIRAAHPEVCINGGVQERGNFSAAAGFSFGDGTKQGLFSTFSAFLEMVISEVTMARLNGARLLCHFSHAGVDDMADNTCHYGINLFLADSGLPEGDTTRMYFAADALQLKSLVRTVWKDEGIRFVFSTRSKVPFICKEDGSKLYDGDYQFVPGKDDIVREGSAGYVVSYGEMLYRALDAVERAREAGIDVGLINKPTLNVVDEDTIKKIGAAPFVLVVESQNRKTGMGSRFGSWLLERGLGPKYAHLGTIRTGAGGLGEHVYHQGIDEKSILAKIQELAR